jgi:hypothetical protein
MKRKTWMDKLAQGGVLLIVPLLLISGLGAGGSSGVEGPWRFPPSEGLFDRLGIPPLTENWCADSDGGQVSTVAGFVEGVGPNGFPFKKYDVCIDENSVKEFYCNGLIAWPVSVACSNGCADGACLTECLDADEDGFSPQGGSCGLVDCDDTNPLVNPGMEENCSNGIDDDCDGAVDGADLSCLVCTDADTDGYAVEGGACGAVDCNDGDPAINPGVIEVCDNGIDDDCDGAVDGDDSQCLGTNIIVIGWDGTQRDHFWECYNGLLPECLGGLPNIASLSNGVIFDMVVTSGETSTKPGWAQIFSGYNADLTGVFSNGQYQPIPEGYTVFEKIEDHFGSSNVVSMFISGKGVNTGDACVGEETTDAGIPTIEEYGQPWCIASDYLDYYENDLRHNDIVGKRALQLIEQHADDLFVAGFVFREPDVIGHIGGENSSRYSSSLVALDTWVGAIVGKLVELGIDEHTIIYVSSDHGFGEDSTRHGNAPFTFLASNDLAVVRGGDRMDIGATILAHYGISLEANGSIPAVTGSPLTSFPDLVCTPEGEAFVDYDSAPGCCEGTTRISFDYPIMGACLPATGGTGDNSGWCTNCGDGICTSPENWCNCPADCP